MSRSIFAPLRPWICKDCRIRIAARKSILTHARAASAIVTPPTPAKPKALPNAAQSLDNPETVERRITSLGGRDNIDELFPRWRLRAGERTMSAAEFSGGFRRQYDQAQDKSEYESKKYTVYGRMIL